MPFCGGNIVVIVIMVIIIDGGVGGSMDRCRQLSDWEECIVNDEVVLEKHEAGTIEGSGKVGSGGVLREERVVDCPGSGLVDKGVLEQRLDALFAASGVRVAFEFVELQEERLGFNEMFENDLISGTKGTGSMKDALDEGLRQDVDVSRKGGAQLFKVLVLEELGEFAKSRGQGTVCIGFVVILAATAVRQSQRCILGPF